jgi:predicted nucleotidyltransferase
MKIGGIIAEYNPYHNGHQYQVESFKREHDITHVVAVMSGNFVQRGDVAIVDKFTRSQMAIRNGVDLVIELPVSYALSSAERFAEGGVYLLNALNCIEKLSFGSSSTVETLQTVARRSEEVRTSHEMLKLLESGVTFPMALSKLMGEYSTVLDDPNNVLGIEYIRALERLNSTIEPTTLTRKNVQHHSAVPVDNFASASYVRELIHAQGDFIKYLPMWDSSASVAKLENLERAILYKLRTSTIEEISGVYDVSHGLEYRILQAGQKSTNLDGLLFGIKSKRYTLSRVRRIVLSLLLGITKDDVSMIPPYARVLAMNSKGIEILSHIKGRANIPIDTSLARIKKLSPQCERFATLESHSTDIYNLSFDVPLPCNMDYTQKVVPFRQNL